VGVVPLALLGAVPRLPLGRGHWHGADATHLDLLLAIVTVTLPDGLQTQFLCSTGHRFSVPTPAFAGEGVESEHDVGRDGQGCDEC
jgi:hypothetical protein